MWLLCTILFVHQVHESLHAGYPIRLSAGLRICAPLRSFSQLITTFFALWPHRHPPWTYLSLDHIILPAPYLYGSSLDLILSFPCSCQKSLKTILIIERFSMGQKRVELLTPALSERCSNQLSYCPKLCYQSNKKKEIKSNMTANCTPVNVPFS